MNRDRFSASAAILVSVLFIILLTSCNLNGATATPTLTVTAAPLPTDTPTTMPTTTATPTATYMILCTPPPCAIGTSETYYCPSLCPGGCGTTCATYTPVLPVAQTRGPLQAVTGSDGIPSGEIYDLWVSPEGVLWVASSSGVFLRSAGGFQTIYDQPLSHIFGEDDAGRVWGLWPGGERITAYDGSLWNVYGSDQGWYAPVGDTFGDGLATDPQGNVWLATGGDDLRRFDPQSGRWISSTAVDIGFTAADPDYQGHYLTDVERSPSGSIWVADCIGMGEGFEGQGVRWFKNGNWNAIPDTEGQCVFDIERDAAGRMRVGAFDALLQYDPVSGDWTQIPLPAWDRRQIVTSLDLDPAGDPWVSILRCGGAGCFSTSAYFMKGGAWLPLLDEGTVYESPPSLAFSTDGTAWVCIQGNVYRRTPEEAESLAKLAAEACEVAVDGTGTVWVAVFRGADAGLWRLRP